MPPTDRATQLRKGVLELAILTLLADGECYGGELVDRLQTVPGLTASSGTIYPLLSRLRKAELVSTDWRESPTGPPRRYYTLTPAGVVARQELTAAWFELDDAMNSLLKGDPTT